MVKNDYITWLHDLESLLQRNNIDFSEYDEFHIEDAILTTEQILKDQNIDYPFHLTDVMIDDYMKHAIQTDPSRKEYYETISCYVKKRFSKR